MARTDDWTGANARSLSYMQPRPTSILLKPQVRRRDQKITSSSLPWSKRSPPPSAPPPIPSSLCLSPPVASCAELDSVLFFSACSASRFFFPWTFLSRKNSSLYHSQSSVRVQGCNGFLREIRVWETHRSASSSSELMYLIVLSSLGIMTCSIAFTRRLVARITSSRIVNAVYHIEQGPTVRLGSEKLD